MDELRRRVLVVDDEQAVCQVLYRALDRVGVDVTTAKSGAEALDALKCKRPNLIIMELELRGMDGLETLRRMRERGDVPPVVALAADGTVERVREALDLGVTEFLAKPFELDRLLKIVCEILYEDVGGKRLAPAR